MIFNQD